MGKKRHAEDGTEHEEDPLAEAAITPELAAAVDALKNALSQAEDARDRAVATRDGYRNALQQIADGPSWQKAKVVAREALKAQV